MRHVVVLEHFPSLPLELLYPLFLLLSSIYISLLQKPSIKEEENKFRQATIDLANTELQVLKRCSSPIDLTNRP